tara:strand:+ start:198 stop:356 length:159 start_codon:yes stop_codon:yes gene_type:complete
MMVFDEKIFEKVTRGINEDILFLRIIITDYIAYYNEQIVNELSEYPDELSKL